MALDPVLPPNIRVAPLTVSPTSLSRLRNHKTSRADSVPAMYSASAVDRAITRCTFEAQEMREP